MFFSDAIRLRNGAVIAIAAVSIWAVGCGGETTAPPPPTTGALSVTINGLPSGAVPVVTVESGTFQRTLNASATLTDLAPGTYTVTGNQTQQGLDLYDPSNAVQSIVVPARETPATVTVAYALSSGALTVDITGLPGSTNADVQVTGPGFSQSLTASQTFNTLVPGSYDIVAAGVISGPNLYTPTPASQTIVVAASTTPTMASVVYTNSGPAPFNLTVADAYLVQAIQRYGAGTSDVAMIEDREAVLRVFAIASVSNSETPDVRVRLYQNGTLFDTRTLSAPSASVPLTPTEGDINLSWNTTIAGNLVQPGLSVLVDVDPTNAVPEDDETDNEFPATGTPKTIDVRSLSPVALRLIPVEHTATSRTGDVNVGNMGSYTAELEKLFPTMGVDVDVGSVYTTSAPALQSDDGNGAWSQILSEIRTLRINDGSSRYYYGVVSPAYSSGIAGLGYVPSSPTSSSKASIGWDKTNSRGWVAVHEIGHNHGRRHSPGCGAGGPDPAYPYSGGSIGVYGLDVAIMDVKSPSTHFDFMTYCNTTWISDYVFDGILQWREAEPLVIPSGAMATTSVMLVWGRITPRGMVLEPAFVMQGRPVMPEQAGAYRVTAAAGDGSTIFSLSFAGDEVADLPNGTERHFAFMVPVGSQDVSRLRSLSLQGPGGLASRQATGRAATPDTPDFTVGRVGNAMRVDWDAREHPMTMVRDRSTGRIVALVRGGAGQVASPGTEVELLFSDGVRSSSRTVRVP